MALYLLDTNIVSYLLDTQSPFHRPSAEGLAGLADEDEAAVSVLTRYEVSRWLAYRRGSDEEIETVLGELEVLPLPPAGAKTFGAAMRDLRATMPRAEVQRSVVDCMIAVTALERRAVLVSHDAAFQRLAAFLPGLQLVDWATG